MKEIFEELSRDDEIVGEAGMGDDLVDDDQIGDDQGGDLVDELGGMVEKEMALEESEEWFGDDIQFDNPVLAKKVGYLFSRRVHDSGQHFRILPFIYVIGSFQCFYTKRRVAAVVVRWSQMI